MTAIMKFLCGISVDPKRWQYHLGKTGMCIQDMILQSVLWLTRMVLRPICQWKISLLQHRFFKQYIQHQTSKKIYGTT